MERVSRLIQSNLLDALKINPILYLSGPRQAGKSTLAQALLKNIGTKKDPAEYVTFDRPVQMAAAASAPEAFLSSHLDSCLVLDEVQLVPEIFRALKILVDDLRLKDKTTANGRFLLTGSANIMTLPNLANPLVGRMSVMTLYPFCTAEAIGGKGNFLERLMDHHFKHFKYTDLSLIEAIKLATYPELINKQMSERAVWFDGYLMTILQRDVRTLAELEKIARLPNLLRLLASRAGNLINDADVSRDVGLNAVTGKTYRNILKMMYLTFDVPPWFRNIGKRLVKSPKGYLVDTLLLCHLLDYQLEEICKKNLELFGRIVENFVATELLKLLSFSNVRMSLFHFRTSDGKEVDFLLEGTDGSVFGLEVKISELVDETDFKSLRLLSEATKEHFKGGAVLYSGKEVVSFGKDLWALPFHVLWQ